MDRPRIGRRLLPLAFALVLIVGMSAGMVLRGPATAQEVGDGHPAFVHAGTCADLGEIAFALSAVGPGTVRESEPQDADDAIGSDDAFAVDVGITTVPVPLAELTDEEHALAVTEGGEDGERAIACGDIGGAPIGNDLTIGLAEQDGSGFTGIALLNGREDETTVTVYLAAGLAGEAASPVADADATPEPAGADAPAAAVSIENFSFSPITLEVAAGTTVTWTNNDAVPHTVTADDGAFESGQIDPGASFSFTVESAGTITYHCDIHPRMTGSLLVT